MNKLGNWLDGHTQHTGCSLQNVIKQNPQTRPASPRGLVRDCGVLDAVHRCS